ncbi:hypothetical protein TNCV_3194871 [Trichonephila clavipes]|uniref:Uncharacterized protein n=1 Tax=Trichonephila clavipes TaxID=2585209 RepID=A0A8X6REE1_TRICX|nr:hypothetical protein TNCV_3194871 [Trichonephila clavipes]
MNSILNKENTIGYKCLKDQQETAFQPYNRLAFWYNPVEDYSFSRHVLIGTMTMVCPYCEALNFSGETKEMCCATGKIKLP